MAFLLEESRVASRVPSDALRLVDPLGRFWSCGQPRGLDHGGAKVWTRTWVDLVCSQWSGRAVLLYARISGSGADAAAVCRYLARPQGCALSCGRVCDLG